MTRNGCLGEGGNHNCGVLIIRAVLATLHIQRGGVVGGCNTNGLPPVLPFRIGGAFLEMTCQSLHHLPHDHYIDQHLPQMLHDLHFHPAKGYIESILLIHVNRQKHQNVETTT